MFVLSDLGYWISLPTAQVQVRGDDGLVVHTASGPIHVDQALVNGVELTPAASKVLHEAGLMGHFYATPAAADYMPADYLESEAAAIGRHLAERGATGKPILFVCCGSGPLAELVARQGFHVHGMDIDETVIQRLSSSARNVGAGSVEYFLADAANFARPDYYAGAFCPLNGIRFLGAPSRVRRHLRLMRSSLVVGSAYYIHLDFESHPALMEWKNDNGNRVTWTVEDPDLLNHEVVERVTYYDLEGRVVADDRQSVSIFDAEVFSTWAEESGFCLDGVYNDRWRPVELADSALDQNFWVRLTAVN